MLTPLGRLVFYGSMVLWFAGGVVMVLAAQTTSVAAMGGVLMGTCGTACVSVYSLDRALTKRRRAWDNDNHAPR